MQEQQAAEVKEIREGATNEKERLSLEVLDARDKAAQAIQTSREKQAQETAAAQRETADRIQLARATAEKEEASALERGQKAKQRADQEIEMLKNRVRDELNQTREESTAKKAQYAAEAEQDR